jgi:hypothetical protein
MTGLFVGKDGPRLSDGIEGILRVRRNGRQTRHPAS